MPRRPRKTPQQKLADQIAREVRRFDRALEKARTPAARAHVLEERARAIQEITSRHAVTPPPSKRWRRIGNAWVARDVPPTEIPHLVNEVSARGQVRVGVTMGPEIPKHLEGYDKESGSALSYAYDAERIAFAAEYARAISENLSAAYGKNPDLYVIEEE